LLKKGAVFTAPFLPKTDGDSFLLTSDTKSRGVEKMKKLLKLTAASVLIAALFTFYINRIPAEYTCYAGEQPQASPFYRIEAESEALSQGSRTYKAKIKLFGFLPIKDATVHRISQKSLVVLGTPFGVKLYTEGVIVVDTEEGSPAAEAGVQVGDIILSYNGKEVQSNEGLAQEVQNCGGNPQTAKILRNQREQTVKIRPKKTAEGYSIGLWVRDSAAGLGTLTYYDPQTQTVAGLGHSISDVDTGQTMPLERGTLVTAEITGIRQGTKGEPGELLGALTNRTFGEVTSNSAAGLFGKTTDTFQGVSYPIGLKDTVREGEAQILCTIQGDTPKAYTIRITKVNNNLSELKNLCITVTDPELLAEAGGIVQGMSGSPILQDGKIIGAVTHVLLDDPQSGYGILIENMLKAAE
jgi:stage IV sporulation protein B